jgi:hypothetical protein
MTATPPLAVDVLAVGAIGPGFADWPSLRAMLREERPYSSAATVVPPPQLLPATERRRAGTIIKVSIVAAEEALVGSGLGALGLPTDIATVFSASEGDGRNCHELCEALASSERLVSPTRFTNSVHNAPAGYWHIARHSMAASTSLCAHDASFAEGLIEAALQANASDAPVLLVVSDAPYPAPLHATRPLPDAMALSMVLSARNVTGRSLGRMALTLEADRIEARSGLALESRSTSGVISSVKPLSSLDDLEALLPAARGLPLLRALAAAHSGRCHVRVREDMRLAVQVERT